MAEPTPTPAREPESVGPESGRPSDGDDRLSQRPLPPITWRPNLVLFLATVASVFVTGATLVDGAFLGRASVLAGAQFAGSVLTILVAHELGHFVTARLHRVDASLPFFLPLPILSPFGTMGAVIRMRGVIPTRNALLDIGASGPLAGMVFAVPLYIWGIQHSTLIERSLVTDANSLGTSLLLGYLDGRFAPAVPDGMDVLLHPVAFGAWGGMFVTMMNLLPVGQLDGGHVAYALLGPRQNKVALNVHRAILAFFLASLGGFILHDVRAGLGATRLASRILSGSFWLGWFEVLAVLGTIASVDGAHDDEGESAAPKLGVVPRIVAVLGLAAVATVARSSPGYLVFGAWFVGLALLLAMEARGGVLRAHRMFDHPPTSAAPLSPVRVAVAVFTLLMFVALFMATPFGT